MSPRGQWIKRLVRSAAVKYPDAIPTAVSLFVSVFIELIVFIAISIYLWKMERQIYALWLSKYQVIVSWVSPWETQLDIFVNVQS